MAGGFRIPCLPSYHGSPMPGELEGCSVICPLTLIPDNINSRNQIEARALPHHAT